MMQLTSLIRLVSDFTFEERPSNAILMNLDRILDNKHYHVAYVAMVTYHYIRILFH